MKIGLNLYQDSLKPEKHYLTLTNVSIVSLLALAMMFGWAGTLYYKHLDVVTLANKTSTQLGYVEEELNNYQQALLQHNDSATFTAQKVKLEREFQVKNVLLNKIMLNQTGKQINYFQVMKDLTEHHDHDLWLTSFMFNKNNVAFTGYSVQSNSVTRWLSYLQETSSFKGREFSHLKIAAVDDQVLQFEAATSSHLLSPAEGTE